MVNKNDNLFEIEFTAIRKYGLTPKDVKFLNFGEHTLFGIDELKKISPGLDNKSAFKMVRGLNESQIYGMLVYKLTAEQLGSPNFGPHTLRAIDFLVENKLVENNEKAFNIVVGLNDEQVSFILGDELQIYENDKFVKLKFIKEILDAMAKFKDNHRVSTNQEAFDSVEKTYYKNLAMGHCKLSNDDVSHPNFGKYTLKIISYLKEKDNLDNKAAFYIAIQYNQDQAKEYVENDMKPQAQKAISNSGNPKEIQDPIKIFDSNKGVCTPEAIRIIKEKSSTLDDTAADKMLRGLNDFQTSGMCRLGLTREQVETPVFSWDTMREMKKLMEKKGVLSIQVAFDSSIKKQIENENKRPYHSMAITGIQSTRSRSTPSMAKRKKRKM